MNHDVDTRHSLCEAAARCEIASDPFHFRGRSRPAREHTHLMASLQKLRYQRAAKVSGTACNQDFHDLKTNEGRGL
jgi:hypothetical protein